MYWWRGGILSPELALLACSFFAVCTAGPINPLTNVTRTESGLKEGSCAVGDVVYMPGDQFPGSTPCERCSCAAGAVQCERQRCEPRPGCKALHRPDHCCPTYQCECEQEGRVYGNGEKLVDPADPCRVCYCQGGEVVCRRIACFVRDDCKPRLVPGRCCPEYDNCPLRGVTSLPGISPSSSSGSTAGTFETSVVPTAPKEIIKPEITIKEITPVSEIPIITEVKIKEILPSPSIEVAEYPSSKSPLIPREATSEKNIDNQYELTERPLVIEVRPSSSPTVITSGPTKTSTDNFSTSKNTDDATPSKISFSTQDSINSEIYPSNIPSLATVGLPSVNSGVTSTTSTTKAPVIIEEEDTPFDHNPAFPPLPDDLSVQGSHNDEIMPETNIDSDHIPSSREILTTTTTSTEATTTKKVQVKIFKDIPEEPLTTEKLPEISTESSTVQSEIVTSTEFSSTKDNSMLNLRSAIPTEILNVPSMVPEDITGELDEIETTLTTQSTPISTIASTPEPKLKIEKSKYSIEDKPEISSSTENVPRVEVVSPKIIETTESSLSTKNSQIETTSSIAKSNEATEVASQTEISSLPIETSDQNPHDVSESITKEKIATTTMVPLVDTTKIILADPEIIAVSKFVPTNTESHSTENIETTEFVLTSFGSSESATDGVELIKISPDSDKSAALIVSEDRQKSNVLKDFINLVGDVASISDHTDEPGVTHHITGAVGISDSEELIPVNAGYKSKNNNWNVNSITEVPFKSKNQVPVTKQKIIEIEDDDSESITDASPPHDKVEPTTRRPIIDNVSDDMVANKTDKKDIEIITQTYVPSVNRQPTKVIMKKSEKTVLEEVSAENIPVSSSAETATESKFSVSSEITTSSGFELSSKTNQRIEALPIDASSTTQ
ncbi:mucin-5AC [Achroia grisella]|uniref:mucin-5AC n=1 Tax=Achroia grisella TaxID=688607 RepID=UPI0027D2E4DB|nr:mucin-5AC [Achroia grisella]